MNCNDTRRDLVAYLYGELPTERRSDLEQHLLACVACRQRADEDRASMRLLDAWPPLELADDERLVSALARATDRRATPPRAASRWRAPLIGSAAAVLLFAMLCWLGADASLDDGRLTIAFGRPSTPPNRALLTNPPPEITHAPAPVTTVELDERLERFTDALDTVLGNLDRRQRDRLLTLARALEDRRARSAEHFDRRLTDVGRELYAETRRNRAALMRVVHVADEPPAAPTRRLTAPRPDEKDTMR